MPEGAHWGAVAAKPEEEEEEEEDDDDDDDDDVNNDVERVWKLIYVTIATIGWEDRGKPQNSLCHGLSLNRALPIRWSVGARWFGYVSQQSVMCLFLQPAEASVDEYTFVVQ